MMHIISHGSIESKIGKTMDCRFGRSGGMTNVANAYPEIELRNQLIHSFIIKDSSIQVSTVQTPLGKVMGSLLVEAAPVDKTARGVSVGY
jgi:hypothetical protein